MLGGCGEQDLRIYEAQVRAPVLGMDRTVGYLVLENRSDDHMTLIGATARGVRAIEMHTTRVSEKTGMMQMRPLETVSIAPGAIVRFEAGGRHLMLLGVSELNETLAIELQFADGSSQHVNFTVLALVP